MKRILAAALLLGLLAGAPVDARAAGPLADTCQGARCDFGTWIDTQLNPYLTDLAAQVGLNNLAANLPLGVAFAGGHPTVSLFYDLNFTVNGSNQLALAANITITTSITVPTLYGGAAPNSTLTLKSTSNGSPSGDSINLVTSKIAATIPGTLGSVLVEPYGNGITYNMLSLSGSNSAAAGVGILGNSSDNFLYTNSPQGLGLQAAGTLFALLSPSEFQPHTDNATALGDSSHRFASLSIAGTITANILTGPSGLNLNLVSATAENIVFQPAGSAGGEWFASTCLYVGSSPADCGANNLEVQGFANINGLQVGNGGAGSIGIFNSANNVVINSPTGTQIVFANQGINQLFFNPAEIQPQVNNSVALGDSSHLFASSWFALLTVKDGANANMILQQDSTNTARNIFSLNGTSSETNNIGLHGGANADGTLYLDTSGGSVNLIGAGTSYLALNSGEIQPTTTNAIQLGDTTHVFSKLYAIDVYSDDSSFLIRAIATQSNAAASATATLTNAPVSGNPTKWVAIDDNGTTRHFPVW